MLGDTLRGLVSLRRRVAELTDIVSELLVPLARGDQDEVARVIERYHESL